ncbi:MAG TPA: DUF1385 domain-containing protein [Thermoleophilia bacterium]|nr:DUF1385 domain-containing protein [Thermoleophilia bacterium]
MTLRPSRVVAPAARVARLPALVLALLAAAPRRAQIGGQAVMEGVMMRGVDHWAVAVRTPDQGIFVDSWPLVSYMKRYRALRLPIVRGVTALVESLVIGIRALTLSANLSLGEEEEELSRKEIGVTLLVAFAFAIGLFFLAPLGITRIFKDQLGGAGFWFWLVEGLVRVAIFVIYLLIVTQFRDLRRVFEYHGAEHMSIHALEHGDPLTVANVEKYKTLHLRCGTSFLLIVMVVSIVVFAIVRWPAWYLLILSRIILVPLIAGISYEIIRWAGRHEDNRVVRVVMAPGLALQWMTTKPPDAAQIEVAIASLDRVIELEPQDRPPVKGVEVMA